MADPIPSVDAFKFVALRPAQLVQAKDTSLSLIRDERTESEPGRHALVQVTRPLSDRGYALQRLAEDAKTLGPLGDAFHALRRAFALSDATQPFDLDAALSALDVRPFAERRAREIFEQAWNALYAAYLTGADAGPRLEMPMAALRLMHTQRLAATGALDERAALATALSATPVIALPTAAKTPGQAPGDAAAPARPPQAAPSAASEPTRYDRLVDEITATQRLLAAARAPRQALRPQAMLEEHSDLRASDGGSVRRADVVVGNVPRLRTAVTPPPAATDVRVLAGLGIHDETSVPVAARALEARLTELNRQAYGLRNQPEFVMSVVRSGNGPLLKLIPPLEAGIAGVFDPLLPHFGATRSTADVDVRGRIKPLGIGDLKVVKQTLLAYVPSEVAHIENVLKGEFKERKHRTLDRTETMLLVSEEETQETERDTQTTDRFELKREAEKTIKEDMSVTAGLTVTGGFGPVSITAQGNFAYSTSQQESTKNSANFAREVVDRSVSKIQKKVKTERTTKNLHEIEEINTHGLDNKAGAGHVTGVYRWVDKKYRAQVYNYGVRMMIEFVVPEPAAYFRASLKAAKSVAVNATPPEPFRDQGGGPLTPSDIDSTNYQLFAARYNAAGVTPPPPEYLYVATAFEQSGLQNAQTFSKSVKDIAIPDGYIWDHYLANTSIIYENNPQFSLQVAGALHHVLNNTNARRMTTAGYGVYWGGDWEDDPRGIVPVSAIGYDIHAYTVHVEVTCRRTQEAYEKWQLQTFDKIYTAYQALKTEYDQKLAQAQAQAGAVIIEGRNPAMNREIEKRELKKLCLTLLTGKHYNDFDAMVYPTPPSSDLPEMDVYEALSEGPTIQFFEQAFDWEQITYLFYPYFWAQKSQWLATSNLTDPDPLFMSFLQAGAARVVLPVPMAYKDAILYFLEQDAIWEGGETPRLDDPLFISIHEELRNRTDDLAGATPEGTPWEFSIPTTLVWLQAGPELPVFVP